MRHPLRVSRPAALCFATSIGVCGLAFSAAPAQADETTGTILAYDRLANLLVLTDRTVWELSPDLLVPSDLAAGDRVRIDFTAAGEDGISSIETLERVVE